MSPRLTGRPVGARPAVPLLFLPREIPHFEVRAPGWLQTPSQHSALGSHSQRQFAVGWDQLASGFECARGSRILVGFRSTRRASSGTGAGPWGLRICWGPTVRAALLDFITAINRRHSVFHGNEDENVWS